MNKITDFFKKMLTFSSCIVMLALSSCDTKGNFEVKTQQPARLEEKKQVDTPLYHVGQIVYIEGGISCRIKKVCDNGNILTTKGEMTSKYYYHVIKADGHYDILDEIDLSGAKKIDTQVVEVILPNEFYSALVSSVEPVQLTLNHITDQLQETLNKRVKAVRNEDSIAREKIYFYRR